MELIDRLERVGTVLGLPDDREAVLLEEHPRATPEARVVVDDEDRRAAVHGRIVSDVPGVRGVANRTGAGRAFRPRMQLDAWHAEGSSRACRACALRGGIAIVPRVARLSRDG